jgi:lysine-N-methylase
MLVPYYVTQFHCIGSACSDTCCAGWGISIDRDTFQDYRRIIHPAVKPLIRIHLEQVDKASSANHGKLGLRPSDSHCGLHGADQSCTLQTHLGENALSDTCYIYPRTINKIHDHFEQSLTLSCPEAARLALTQDNAFEFVGAEFTSRVATIQSATSTHGFAPLATEEVRAFCIQLFQTPDLSNTERLAVLGWLCSQLDMLVASNSHASVDGILLELRDMIENGGLRSIVSQLANQHAISVTLFSILFGAKLGNGNSENQREVFNWVRQGLGLNANETLDLDVLERNYLRGRQRLAECGDLFEKTLTRYLLNDLIREVFPWNQATTMRHYRRLITRFGILRLMLSGVAASHEKPLNERQMVQVVQVFCRLFQHSDKFASDLN